MENAHYRMIAEAIVMVAGAIIFSTVQAFGFCVILLAGMMFFFDFLVSTRPFKPRN